MIAAARLPLRNDPAKSQFLRPRALKIAQRVGAFVPDRMPVTGTVTLYARHASDFVDGLLHDCRRSSFREL